MMYLNCVNELLSFNIYHRVKWFKAMNLSVHEYRRLPPEAHDHATA